MNDLTDFNDLEHRVQSACAVWQKGLYHLFVLKNEPTSEMFEKILRLYQCLFQLSLTQLLLDTNFNISTDQIPPRLRRRCKDPKHPTRKELDPASIVTHTTFERHWSGFRNGHALHEISLKTLTSYKRTVEARHNLLYRPFMLAPNFWEDCTLIDLLNDTPKIEDVEQLYQDFIKAILNLHILEQETLRSFGSVKRIAGYFLDELFIPYRDMRGQRPSETLLISYARMLNPDNPELLDKLRGYRNQLVDFQSITGLRGIFFPENWHAGEL